MLRVLEALGGPVLRAHARRLSRRFLRAARDCRGSQERVLQRLLRLNAGSRFQQNHRLSAGTRVEAFRRQVPVGDYATHAPYIEALKKGDHTSLCGAANPLQMFALSSGTTGDTKFIPITRQFLKDYRRGWSVWGIHAFDDHPRLHRLRILQLASDHDRFRTSAGIPCGHISGLVQCMQSRIFRFKYTLPSVLLGITEPAAKSYTLLRLALADREVGLIVTANPSTLVHLAREMHTHLASLLRDLQNGTLAANMSLPPRVRRALAPHISQANPQRARELVRQAAHSGTLRPAEAWPALTMLGLWTGGSAGAYLPAVREAYGDVPIRDHGLSASEGRMTIPFRDGTSSGALDVGTHFFEFIPEDQIDRTDPDTLLAHELEADRCYYILLTTASGLHRYNICDVVRCTGHVGTTPLLEFLHKGAHVASITGEKVTESQVVSAVSSVTQRLALRLSHYTVTPTWGAPPAYQLLLEASELPHPGDPGRVASLVDLELQRLNCEYSDKRASGRLASLKVQLLPPGTWTALIRRKQSQTGGSLEQYKHPCLQPELDFTEKLLQGAAAKAA